MSMHYKYNNMVPLTLADMTTKPCGGIGCRACADNGGPCADNPDLASCCSSQGCFFNESSCSALCSDIPNTPEPITPSPGGGYDPDDFDGPMKRCASCLGSEDPFCCEDTQCNTRPGGCPEGCAQVYGPGTPCMPLSDGGGLDPNNLRSKCNQKDRSGKVQFPENGCYQIDQSTGDCVYFGHPSVVTDMNCPYK